VSNSDHLGAWVLFGAILFGCMYATVRALWGNPAGRFEAELAEAGDAATRIVPLRLSGPYTTELYLRAQAAAIDREWDDLNEATE